ncbi:MAG: sulfite exporter TauE/SafE family protein [Paracoccaceae bacterium]
MEQILADFGLLPLLIALAIMVFAGLVKGTLGFGLPMIAISGLGSIYAAEIAIAALIIPTLATNLWQGLRNGPAAAFGSLRDYWRLNLVMLVMIWATAQLVTSIPSHVLLLFLGGVVTFFGMVQVLGWRPQIAARHNKWLQYCVGFVSGFIGGLSGVWGPPILLFLLSLNTPKVELVRVQGLCFLTGSVVLGAAHLQSGVLNATTIPLSALLLVPTLVGMAIGFKVQDRLNQEWFRKVTLIVLVLAGANLLRRGMGF